MLALNEAVSKSLSILKETFAVPSDTTVELEEARRLEEPDEWLVTFSYPDPSVPEALDQAGAYLRQVLKSKRAYKEIRIKALDGEITAVRNVHL